VRIALVNAVKIYGGGEKRVLALARELERLGQEVRVLAQPDGKLLEMCRKQGVPCAPVPLRRHVYPGGVLRLARALRELGADAVVCYSENTAAYAGFASRLARSGASGKPVPVLFYYSGAGVFRKSLFNRLVVSPLIARFVPNAEATRRELAELGWISPERVRRIYDGVDAASILNADPGNLREELGAGPHDVVVLTVGRLMPYKGHGLLVELVGELAPEHPNLKLWIAGGGREGPSLQRKVQELGLRGRVRLLGFRADVPRLLRAADILCHPSRREGAPNAVLEGMAAGLPVAAVAAYGTAEYVVDGETGLLSAVDDRAGLKRNLEALLADAALRQRMGEAGQRRALTEFTEGRSAEQWLELLTECAR
jgi:glycosyltransferase involved in cell wall biosynthesis